MIETSLCYIEHNDKYLMLHRTKKEKDVNQGKWIGIGGKQEPGENMTECLKREVLEETGLKLNSFRARGIITFISEGWEPEKMFLFTSDDFEGDPESVENFTCSEGLLKWVKKDEVEGLNLWEGDRVFLKKLAQNEPFFFMRLGYVGDELTTCVVGGENFADKVYEAVAHIPYGMVTTYGEIANLAGYPGAARAVGNALHNNPYEGIIPCHRVVNAQGKLAENFCFDGPEEQARRLEDEGVKVKDGYVAGFKKQNKD